MKYLIFELECLAFVLWFIFGPRQSWPLMLLGFVVIIGLSQLCHQLLKAR